MISVIAILFISIGVIGIVITLILGKKNNVKEGLKISRKKISSSSGRRRENIYMREPKKPEYKKSQHLFKEVDLRDESDIAEITDSNNNNSKDVSEEIQCEIGSEQTEILQNISKDESTEILEKDMYGHYYSLGNEETEILSNAGYQFKERMER